MGCSGLAGAVGGTGESPLLPPAKVKPLGHKPRCRRAGGRCPGTWVPWILQEVWATCQANGLVAKVLVIPFDAIQAESALLSPPISLQPFCIHLGSSTPFVFYLATFCLFLSLCISCFFLGTVAVMVFGSTGSRAGESQNGTWTAWNHLGAGLPHHTRSFIRRDASFQAWV